MKTTRIPNTTATLKQELPQSHEIQYVAREQIRLENRKEPRDRRNGMRILYITTTLPVIYHRG